jgi:hypothetical protein
MPTGSAAAAAIAPGEMIEFAAVRTIGQATEIDLYDTQEKEPLDCRGRLDRGHDGRELRRQPRAGRGENRRDGQGSAPAQNEGQRSGPAPIVTSSPAMNFALPPPVPETVAASGPAGPASVASPADSTASAGAPPPASLTPPAPTVPLTIARQEEEARMLVSDLLEIGMAQRKAYEEKQRQQSDPNAIPAQPAPAEPVPGGPPSGTH